MMAEYTDNVDTCCKDSCCADGCCSDGCCSDTVLIAAPSKRGF